MLISAKMASKEYLDWSAYSYELRAEEAMKAAGNHNKVAQVAYGTSSGPSLKKLTKVEIVTNELKEELTSRSLSKLVPQTQLVADGNRALYDCIPENAILLHISSARDSVIMLCITSEGVIGIHNLPITDRDMLIAVLRFSKLLRSLKSGHSTSLPSLQVCEEHLRSMSAMIIKPVEESLTQKEHVIFAADTLGKFPLCALKYNNRPLFLSKDVSQVPSLASLRHFAEKPRSQGSRIDIIFQDGRDKHPLDISTSAALSTARRVKAQPHQANELNHNSLGDVYRHSNILLITTHGEQSETSPWKSSILLQPPLQVLDLVNMQSNAALVVFEACVSGLGEDTTGNDLIGF